jgi:hypothetical protein
MTRTRTLIVSTAVALTLPFGAAVAQTVNPSPAAPSSREIGRTQSMPDYVPSPMQEQAMAPAPAPNMAPMTNECGSPRIATMTDEYGRKYNCRGDRVR